MPHGPRVSDEHLRSLARERIADGRLPVIFSHSMQAGHGSGTRCCVCEQPIEPQHIEYEVTDYRSGAQMSFHFACHAIWQLECRAWSLAGEAQSNPTVREDG